MLSHDPETKKLLGWLNISRRFKKSISIPEKPKLRLLDLPVEIQQKILYYCVENVFFQQSHPFKFWRSYPSSTHTALMRTCKHVSSLIKAADHDISCLHADLRRRDIPPRLRQGQRSLNLVQAFSTFRRFEITLYGPKYPESNIIVDLLASSHHLRSLRLVASFALRTMYSIRQQYKHARKALEPFRRLSGVKEVNILVGCSVDFADPFWWPVCPILLPRWPWEGWKAFSEQLVKDVKRSSDRLLTDT